MIIVNETELMDKQKTSTTIIPDVEFKALETSVYYNQKLLQHLASRFAGDGTFR